MTEDQFYRIIGVGVFTPIVLWILSTIKQAVDRWIEREGGVGRALGKRVGRLIKHIRNTTP